MAQVSPSSREIFGMWKGLFSARLMPGFRTSNDQSPRKQLDCMRHHTDFLPVITARCSVRRETVRIYWARFNSSWNL